MASHESDTDNDATNEAETVASQPRKPVIARPPMARIVMDDDERPSFRDVHGLMDDAPQSTRSW